MSREKNRSQKSDLSPHAAEETSIASEAQVGARIRLKREALGLNFEEFAALTREYDPDGISAVTLRRYERVGDGGSLPGLRELRILCDALDVSADFLLRNKTSTSYEQQAVKEWEALREILVSMTAKHRIPGLTGEDPYGQMTRQAALSRAKLHTKKND